MSAKQARDGREDREIEISGAIARVPLTQGHFAIIDAADVHLVEGWKWTAKAWRRNVYAYRKERIPGGKQRTIQMHRLIAGADEGVDIDHIDSDGLNNRRSNLRSCSHAENLRNVRKHIDNTSGFKGVFWDKSRQKWRAEIMVSGAKVFLGRFPTLHEAHAEYALASANLHGDFARAV